MDKLILLFTLFFLWGCSVDENLADFEEKYSRTAMKEISVSLYNTGEDITCTFTNNSNEDLYIFASDLPLKELEKNIFKVSDGNEFIPYIGKMVTRVNSINNWVLIEFGKTITYNIKLGNFYNINESGYYDVYYDSFVSILTSEKQVEYINLTSNLITSHMSFSQKTVPDRASCSAKQLTLLNKGKNIAGKYTNSAKAYLAKYGPDLKYKKWFGAKTTARYNTVVDGFKKMSLSFPKKWSYSCESKDTNDNCGDYAAWVYGNQPYKVWVCMNYYEKATDENRGTLMVHEASHWKINFDANDYGYGKDTGLELAKSDPDKAINCANNIQYYTWEVHDYDSDINTPPNTTHNITLPKRVWKLNEAVKVIYSGLKSKKNYIIGLFPRGKSNNKNPIKTIAITGKTSGYITKKMQNVKPGKYEFHLYNPGSSNILSKVNLVLKSNNAVLIESDTLTAGNVMYPQQTLISSNKQFEFKFQLDGNLVLKNLETKRVIWASGTNGKGGEKLTLQNDGNLVLRTDSNKLLWDSGTNGRQTDKLQLLTDGNLVLKNTRNNVIWSVPGRIMFDSERAGAVIVYEHRDFEGKQIYLKRGEHDLNDLEQLGSPNDSVSSIKVAIGYEAVIFEHHHFGGISHIIKGNINNLDALNFNDKISSIIIRKEGVDPPPPPDSAWTFIVAGDTRTNDSAHRDVLKAIKRYSPHYKIYLNSGDVVAQGNNKDQWDTFKEALVDTLGNGWQSGNPYLYLAAPGNHDMVDSNIGLKNWNSYLSFQANYGNKGRSFYYKYKNATFIILNSDASINDQVKFLENAVSNAKTTWIFAMWHHPNLYSQWINVLVRAKFDGVFHGHAHVYNRTEKGTYFITIVGTGGAPLESNQVYGYLECEVDGDEMIVKYIKANDGSVLDQKVYVANKK